MSSMAANIIDFMSAAMRKKSVRVGSLCPECVEGLTDDKELPLVSQL